MILRRGFLPKSKADITCTSLLIFVFIPFIYWFEVYVVLSYFFSFSTLWYTLHWIAGNFVCFNIISNVLALMLCDTSIKGRVMPAELQTDWKFCSACESVSPPRSWHCETCQTCILKRDHHCLFAGCCVGHDNYRYFVMFIFYMFIALTYTIYFNSYYVWNVVNFANISWISFIFPLAMVIYSFTPDQFYLLVYIICLIFNLFVGIMMYLHFSLVVNGQSMHERGNNSRIYDMGLKDNVRSALGDRWYLVWISPFVKSELPGDGVNWKKRETEKSK